MAADHRKVVVAADHRKIGVRDHRQVVEAAAALVGGQIDRAEAAATLRRREIGAAELRRRKVAEAAAALVHGQIDRAEAARVRRIRRVRGVRRVGNADRRQIDFEAERGRRRRRLRRGRRRGPGGAAVLRRRGTIHRCREADLTRERGQIEVVEAGQRRRRHLRRSRGRRRSRCGRCPHDLRHRGLHSREREPVVEVERRRAGCRRGGSRRRRCGGSRRHRGRFSGAERADADHRLLHFRPVRGGRTGDLRRRRGRSCSFRRVRYQKRMPALGATHLEAGRRNTALVDLIRSLAGLALDLEHAPVRLSQWRSTPRKPDDL